MIIKHSKIQCRPQLSAKSSSRLLQSPASVPTLPGWFSGGHHCGDAHLPVGHGTSPDGGDSQRDVRTCCGITVWTGVLSVEHGRTDLWGCSHCLNVLYRKVCVYSDHVLRQTCCCRYENGTNVRASVNKQTSVHDLVLLHVRNTPCLMSLGHIS